MTTKQSTIFRYSLLRIVAAMFIFEIVVGLMAFAFLLLPVLQNHARNFAEQINLSQLNAQPELVFDTRPPADGGKSWLPFNFLLAAEIERLTGEPCEVRKVANQPSHYWLPYHSKSAHYLVFDHRTVVGAMPMEAFISWFTLALIAGLLIATWLAQGLSRPITQLRNSLKNHSDSTPIETAAKVGIIELEDLRTEFVTLSNKLSLAVDDRTTLLLGLSHEISAPVARLTMGFELYAKQIERGKHEDMEADLDEMRRIIAQFLSAARCLSTQEQQQYSLVHLMRWLQQRYADKANVQVDIPLQDSDYAINVTALERILVNLIDNALRHASHSAIRVSIETQANLLVFSVADSGPGIPEADIPRLFHPFEKRAGSQGVGLGLALSRLIAEQNGWKLEISNKPGGGLICNILITK